MHTIHIATLVGQGGLIKQEQRSTITRVMQTGNFSIIYDPVDPFGEVIQVILLICAKYVDICNRSITKFVKEGSDNSVQSVLPWCWLPTDLYWMLCTHNTTTLPITSKFQHLMKRNN
jgi:hypothetical protein